jgi:hypothetical protein
MADAGGVAATAVELALETLARTGQLRMRASGASMLPVLAPGDELEIRSCTLAEIAPGDVVLFCRDGRLFAHRVLALCGGRLLAQGDALATPDPEVLAGDVLGKVVEATRKGRGVALTSPGWLGRRWRSVLRSSDFATRLALGWHRFADSSRA